MCNSNPTLQMTLSYSVSILHCSCHSYLDFTSFTLMCQKGRVIQSWTHIIQINNACLLQIYKYNFKEYFEEKYIFLQVLLRVDKIAKL